MEKLIKALLVGTWGYMPKAIAWFFIFSIPTGCYHVLYGDKPVMVAGTVLGGLVMALSLVLSVREENIRERKAKELVAKAIARQLARK
jgi:hypothetical protein